MRIMIVDHLKHGGFRLLRNQNENSCFLLVEKARSPTFTVSKTAIMKQSMSSVATLDISTMRSPSFNNNNAAYVPRTLVFIEKRRLGVGYAANQFMFIGFIICLPTKNNSSR